MEKYCYPFTEIGDLIKEEAGGEFLDQGIHLLDMVLFFCNGLMKFTVLFQIIFGHMKLKIMPMF